MRDIWGQLRMFWVLLRQPDPRAETPGNIRSNPVRNAFSNEGRNRWCAWTVSALL